MLIIEALAKTKFCPLGRGAAPVGGGKFASGVNMAPQGVLTTCVGSECMLWEANGELTEHTPDGDCQICGGGEAKEKCAACKGTGKTFKAVKHSVGFCGAGYQGPAVAALNEVTQALKLHTAAVTGRPLDQGDARTRFTQAGRPLPKTGWWARLRAHFTTARNQS